MWRCVAAWAFLCLLPWGVTGEAVWGFSGNDTTWLRRVFLRPGTFESTFPGVPIESAVGPDLGHWEDMLTRDPNATDTWDSLRTERQIHDRAEMLRSGELEPHTMYFRESFAQTESRRAAEWRYLTGTTVDGFTDAGSTTDVYATMRTDNLPAVQSTWKSHPYITTDGYGTQDRVGRTSAAMNHFVRHVTFASSGEYVSSSGRAATASYTFAVNLTEFQAATSVPRAARETVLSFKALMDLGHAHGATVAWRWAAERFGSRRQVDVAPHAVSAYLRRIAGLSVNASLTDTVSRAAVDAAVSSTLQGYPPGGLPWTGDTIWATNPERETNPVGRGGAAYEYGPVLWDAEARVIVYKVFEYADGDVTTSKISNVVGLMAEAEGLRNITLEDALTLDGGLLRDTLFPPRVLGVTLFDVRKHIGRTLFKWSWSAGWFSKEYDHDLIDKTYNRIWERVNNYNASTAERYGQEYATVFSARHPWGVIRTCRSDAPGTSCEAGASGDTIHADVFDIRCAAPRRVFKVDRCEANQTVSRAIVDNIYDRSAKKYSFTSRLTQSESPTYSRLCHNAFSVCYRGVRAGGYRFTSLMCGRNNGIGAPCAPFTSSRGGSTLEVKHSVTPSSGWVDIRTGQLFCLLGKGGPSCSVSCGDMKSPDMVGRSKSFPHHRCHGTDWESCDVVDPGGPFALDNVVNCSRRVGCSADVTDALAPRNQGCSRHGNCFTDADPANCVCGPNVQGKFCDSCVPGFYGYNSRLAPIDQDFDNTGPCRTPSGDACASLVSGPLSRVPFSAPARQNGSLMDLDVLYYGTSVLSGGGGRRLSDGPATVVTDPGANDEWLFLAEGRGAILRPPTTSAIGCSGSCWGWRPEDGVTDNLKVFGEEKYVWDAGGSSGRYSLRDSCGVSDGDVPAYAGATETFSELASRCLLDVATSEDEFISRAESCRATPLRLEERRLGDVCNFQDTTCSESVLSVALHNAGFTPNATLGCVSRDSTPYNDTPPSCSTDAMAAALLSPGDVTLLGGWHAEELYCENVNSGCVLDGEVYGAEGVDADGVSNGVRDIDTDEESGEVVYASRPCDSCGPMHVNEVLRRWAPAVESLGAWELCPELCDPRTFFAHALPGGEDAGRRRGIVPAWWLGCPTAPPLWVSDWRQCLPEHFYTGEATRLHVGDPHGLGSSEDVPSDWLPAFASLWSSNTTVLYEDSNCSWVPDGSLGGTWNCSSTVRGCGITTVDGVVCGDLLRPVWQGLNGITPQTVLGCPLAWATDTSLVNRARLLGEDDDVCDIHVFSRLNLGNITHPPSPDNFSAVDPDGVAMGKDVRVSEPRIVLPVIESSDALGDTPAYSCTPRVSVWGSRVATVNGSVVLGHMCGGPRRAATCSIFDTECVGDAPPCHPGSIETCGCHDVGGCTSCRPGSNLDPEKNCVECLLRHVWVEDGNFDTCVFVGGCFETPDSDLCGGHGRCIVSATRPSFDSPEDPQRVVYTSYSGTGAVPFSATDGYSGIETKCVCDADWTGTYCGVDTTACWNASRLGGTSNITETSRFHTGFDAPGDGSNVTQWETVCRLGTPVSMSNACLPDALVMLIQPLKTFQDYLAAHPESLASVPFWWQPHEFLPMCNMFTEWCPYLFQPSCAMFGARDATTQDFFAASSFSRHIPDRFFAWVEASVARFTDTVYSPEYAVGHSPTQTVGACFRMMTHPGGWVMEWRYDSGRLVAVPADRDCSFILPPMCVVDTCSQSLDSAAFLA